MHTGGTCYKKGIGFEINDQYYGSIYSHRQIIYWKDVDRFYIHKRGWRKFLVIELLIGITYHFDISLYDMGDVAYFGEMMRLYWDKNEQQR